MSINHWVAQATAVLEDAGIGTARLDVLVLMEDQLGKDRAWLLAHPDFELGENDENVLNGWIARRARHVPLAYVRGKTEFYGREFIVSEAVLEPRPESETMIDLLKEILKTAPELAHCHSGLDPESRDKEAPTAHATGLDPSLRRDDDNVLKTTENRSIRVADVGTGSGALGITAALEVLNLTVDLLEIDDKALKIAKMNVVRHATGNRVIKSDLLAESDQNYHILLCNLPYVPDDFHINTAASHEPKIAIFGGPDGLDLYRKLFQQLEKLKQRPLYILIEILPFQKAALVPIAKACNYQLLMTDDFIHVFKDGWQPVN